jgi:actin-like protein 6A
MEEVANYLSAIKLLWHLVVDEVSALVLDIGASSIRCGYAGDDSPKSIFTTSYGYNQQNIIADQTSTDPSIVPEPKIVRHIGEQGPQAWRSGMEVTTPLKDGLS